MTSERLLALFTPHGKVIGGEAKIKEDGNCKGFGFVVMSTEEEANKAIAEVNGMKVGAHTISVLLAPGWDNGKDNGEEVKEKRKRQRRRKQKGDPDDDVDIDLSLYHD